MKARDWAVNWLVEKGKALYEKFFGKNAEKEDKKEGGDLAAVEQEIKSEGAEKEKEDGEIKKEEADQIAEKVKMDQSDVIKTISVKDGGETWDFEYVQRALAASLPKKANRALGGAHRSLDFITGKQERHHMPSWDAIQESNTGIFSYGAAPALVMDKADHYTTSSWGKLGKSYSLELAELIKAGKFKVAQRRDIKEVKNMFPGKYDKGISQMLDYTNANI